MSPDEIRALMERLGLDSPALAAQLGVSRETVEAWQCGDEFPTQRNLRKLENLNRGEARAPMSSTTSAVDPERHRLADPNFWEVCRKLVAHREFFDQVLELSARYADPAENGNSSP